MPWGAAIAVGGSLLSSSMQSDATEEAAAGQQAATRESNALQRYMYDNNVALQSPNINTGNAARDRLSYLLGLSPTGYSGNTGGAPTLTYDQLRAQLLGQYTKQNAAVQAAGPDLSQMSDFQRASYERQQEGGSGGFYGAGNGPGYWGNEVGTTGQREWISTAAGGAAPTTSIDEAGLDAAIRAKLAEQDAARKAIEDAAKNDPNYGRLAQQYVPDKFSFTSQDFLNNKDPGYEWRLQQGQKALDRQGAAAGRFLSGAQLQASSDYNQGAASQEFQSAYGRALGTFGTNEGNRFNAYQANFNNSVNPLLALSGAATLGSQNLGNAGSAYASQVGSNLQNNANAQGAAGIASANSIGGGITNAIGGYQQNQLLSSLMNGRGVNNNPSGGGLGGLDAASVYGAGSGWGSA